MNTDFSIAILDAKNQMHVATRSSKTRVFTWALVATVKPKMLTAALDEAAETLASATAAHAAALAAVTPEAEQSLQDIKERQRAAWKACPVDQSLTWKAQREIAAHPITGAQITARDLEVAQLRLDGLRNLTANEQQVLGWSTTHNNALNRVPSFQHLKAHRVEVWSVRGATQGAAALREIKAQLIAAGPVNCPCCSSPTRALDKNVVSCLRDACNFSWSAK
jgi:hypothetical protein